MVGNPMAFCPADDFGFALPSPPNFLHSPMHGTPPESQEMNFSLKGVGIKQG
jgi:hypothetical protein